MRFIDADALDEILETKFKDEKTLTPIEARTIRKIRKIIKEIPTVDEVEVVRCKDCKYDGSCMTQIFVEENSYIPFDKNTFYCADGERKDNGEEDEDAEK